MQNQFGFQKGKSTVDCIFTLHSIISKTLDAKEKLYCVFVVYEKAFDKVDRSLLWHKLIKDKVSSKLVKALSSMYTVVKLCIRYQSSKSRFFSSHINLKQGDPSSPLMFMILSIISLKTCMLSLMKYLQSMNYVCLFCSTQMMQSYLQNHQEFYSLCCTI